MHLLFSVPTGPGVSLERKFRSISLETLEGNGNQTPLSRDPATLSFTSSLLVGGREKPFRT